MDTIEKILVSKIAQQRRAELLNRLFFFRIEIAFQELPVFLTSRNHT
ncbi:hypothetical protein BB65665_10530 [Bacillus sp. 916]|nr:hypothetical protein BB65665_10530 [Bacillus sp. 916]